MTVMTTNHVCTFVPPGGVRTVGITVSFAVTAASSCNALKMRRKVVVVTTTYVAFVPQQNTSTSMEVKSACRNQVSIRRGQKARDAARQFGDSFCSVAVRGPWECHGVAVMELMACCSALYNVCIRPHHTNQGLYRTRSTNCNRSCLPLKWFGPSPMAYLLSRHRMIAISRQC